MKTLISKLGASGDVLRTTVLLSELGGDISWLTKEYNKDLLKSRKISKIYYFENREHLEQLRKQEFDLLLSLDEEKEPLEFLKEIKTKKLIGHFLDQEGKVDYTPECNYWLNMSFISKKYSREEADELKKINTKSIPQIFIEILGKKWTGQKYELGIVSKPLFEVKGIIGLIDISESKWPNKFWAGYSELKKLLEKDGYKVSSLGMRPSIADHIDDINNCELIVCGDTLGMHIALALRKKVVALFNCTPPNEIFDYGIMKKVISQKIDKYYFNRTYSEEAVSAIPVDEVYTAVKEALKD